MNHDSDSLEPPPNSNTNTARAKRTSARTSAIRAPRKGTSARATTTRAPRKRKAKEVNSDTEYSAPETKKKKVVGKGKAPRKPVTDDVQAMKPDPIGMPAIWADNRQALCNALPWFHGAFESAAYTNKLLARGFMCDAQVAIRDKFDTEIVISRM